MDYEPAVVVNAEKKENQKSERTNSFRCMEEFVHKVLDGADMVRDVRFARWSQWVDATLKSNPKGIENKG